MHPMPLTIMGTNNEKYIRMNGINSESFTFTFTFDHRKHFQSIPFINLVQIILPVTVYFRNSSFRERIRNLLLCSLQESKKILPKA